MPQTPCFLLHLYLAQTTVARSAGLPSPLVSVGSGCHRLHCGATVRSSPAKAASVMLLCRSPFFAQLTCFVSFSLPVAARAAENAAALQTDPPGLASFTRAIQPLLLNRCAAGACHGSPAAARPQLIRGPTRGRVDRPTTLENLQQVSDAVDHEGGDLPFLQAVLRNHPPAMLRGRPATGLLTVRERQLLATWLATFMQPAANMPNESVQEPASQGVTPAAFNQPVNWPPHKSPPAATTVPGQADAGTPTTARPNRFRQLLEQAANPPQLPPPRVTRPLQLEKVLPDDFPPLPPVADDAVGE